MEYSITNISHNFERLLKKWFSPGETMDLEKLFLDFSTDNPRHEAMFKKNEFDKFVVWVTELAQNDPGKWSIELPDDYKIKKKPTKKSTPVKEEPITVQKTRAEIPNLKASELAWLPYNDDTKSLVMHYNNPKELMKAEDIASNLAGRENLRKLFRKRIQELNAQGKY